MSSKDYQPPKRKEPGLLGSTISGIVQLMVWLLVSLLLSFIIEWIGIAYFWPEQGESHAKTVLAKDIAYLNVNFKKGSDTFRYKIADRALNIKNQLGQAKWFDRALANISSSDNKAHQWLNSMYQRYEQHILAMLPVTQIFVVRLAIIIFSLPAFFLAAGMGAIDGLVERDLRRWGGGRESSNVYNLARRSVIPAFIGACVVYISLPFSVHPAIIILPFAVCFGFAVRVGFERLKKYF